VFKISTGVRDVLINPVLLLLVVMTLKCGRGVGDFILGELNGVSQAIIITPWLSPETARLLTSLAKNGARITLVTTDDTENQSHARALPMLYEEVEARKQGSKALITAGALLLLLGIIMTVPATTLSVLAILAGIVVLLLGLPRTVQVRRTPIDLVILPRGTNLHAKLVIIPERGLVGVGSANMTSSGLHNNIECWVWLGGEPYVREALAFVESLTGRGFSAPRGFREAPRTHGQS
jgi:phosphatidylserine/phosphatidylglycerophosphate/cardiolipin synthase-like enzyme